MSAAGAVHVSFFMPVTVMVGGATLRIGVIDLENMLFHVAPVGVVKTTVVKIVDVPVVMNSGVTAVGSMNMIVMRVVTRHKRISFYLNKCSSDGSLCPKRTDDKPICSISLKERGKPRD